MARSCQIEALEGRLLMSVAAPLADELPLSPPAVTVAAARAALVPNSYFVGIPRLGGISGKLALKIRTVSGTALAATLYSTDFGGFNVPVTGTIGAAGNISLTGRTTNCRVTAFKATLSNTGKVISGSCTIVQMGLALKGTLTQTRTAAAPVLKTPNYPSLLGTYTGAAPNGDPVTLVVTRQSGGLFWGTSNNAGVFTGFQPSPGVIRLHDIDADGYTDVTGTIVNGGALDCQFTFHGTDGEIQSGHMLFSRS